MYPPKPPPRSYTHERAIAQAQRAMRRTQTLRERAMKHYSKYMMRCEQCGEIDFSKGLLPKCRCCGSGRMQVLSLPGDVLDSQNRFDSMIEHLQIRKNMFSMDRLPRFENETEENRRLAREYAQRNRGATGAVGPVGATGLANPMGATGMCDWPLETIDMAEPYISDRTPDITGPDKPVGGFSYKIRVFLFAVIAIIVVAGAGYITLTVLQDKAKEKAQKKEQITAPAEENWNAEW